MASTFFEAAIEVASFYEDDCLSVVLSEPAHVLKRFSERGGENCLSVFLDTLNEDLKSNPEVIDLLLQLHIEVEESKKSLLLQFPNGNEYVLTYNGFNEKYFESFDCVTYFNTCYSWNENKKHLSVNSGDIIVNVDLLKKLSVGRVEKNRKILWEKVRSITHD